MSCTIQTLLGLLFYHFIYIHTYDTKLCRIWKGVWWLKQMKTEQSAILKPA